MRSDVLPEMEENEMNLLDAPEQGTMYALYTDRVVYQKYNREDLPEEEILKEKLLELHLFDEEVEYRCIKTRRGEIEARISDKISHEDQYTEQIFTLDGEKVDVINYITYDENDLMRIDNYRLKEVR